MFKYLVTLSVVALTASFVACGGTSGNGGIPTAPLVQDESADGGTFAGSDIRVLSADDPQVKLVSQTDGSCADPKGAGHQVVDSRLTPQTRFERTVKAGLGGQKAPNQFSIASTILTNTSDSYSRRDVYKLSSGSRTDQVTCDFKTLTIPENQSWLNCLDQNSVKAIRPKSDDVPNQNHCHVAWSHDPKDNKTTYQGLTLMISGKKINATKETVELDGLLTCDNKPVGPGKTIDVTIYSYDIPSLVKDSCSPGKIYFHHTKMDNLNHVYENNSEGLTSFLLPVENIDEELPLPASSRVLDLPSLIAPPVPAAVAPAAPTTPTVTVDPDVSGGFPNF
jgi:hypothetical protein